MKLIVIVMEESEKIISNLCFIMSFKTVWYIDYH